MRQGYPCTFLESAGRVGGIGYGVRRESGGYRCVGRLGRVGRPGRIGWIAQGGRFSPTHRFGRCGELRDNSLGLIHRERQRVLRRIDSLEINEALPERVDHVQFALK